MRPVAVACGGSSTRSTGPSTSSSAYPPTRFRWLLSWAGASWPAASTTRKPASCFARPSEAALISGSRRLTGPRDVPLSRAVIGTGFSYDAERRGRQGALVAAMLPRIADIRRIGSASLDLCFVSAGRLDGYFEVGLNAWDWAAGALIAQEAGCVVSGLPGRPVGQPVVAAAGGSVAPDFLALWRSSARTEV